MNKESRVINYNFFYWGPFLYKTTILKEELDKIKLLCKKNKKKDYRKNLAGLIKNEYSIDRKKVFPILFPYIQSYIQGSIEHYQIGYGNKITLTSSWVNYMTKFESNPIHRHDSEISFVLYTKIPDNLNKEIEQTISNDTKPGTINFVNQINDGKQKICMNSFTPTEGDLFMFPSSLHHYVNSFQCEGERISISGNIKTVNNKSK